MKRLLLPSIALVLVLPTACKPKTPAASPVAAPESAATGSPPAAAPAPVAENGTPTPPSAPGGPGQRGSGGPGGGAENFQQRAAQRMERMKAELGLSEDQSQKINTIMEAQFAAMRAGGDPSTMSREDRRAAFQKAREAANSQIEQILTPEQMPKWQAMQEERRNRRGGGQGRPQN